MRLPVFLVGFIVTVVASTAFGIAADFKTGKLALFVVGVVIVVQLAYVGLVALLAFQRKQSTQRRSVGTPKTHSTPVSPENDV